MTPVASGLTRPMVLSFGSGFNAELRRLYEAATTHGNLRQIGYREARQLCEAIPLLLDVIDQLQGDLDHLRSDAGPDSCADVIAELRDRLAGRARSAARGAIE